MHPHVTMSTDPREALERTAQAAMLSFGGCRSVIQGVRECASSTYASPPPARGGIVGWRLGICAVRQSRRGRTEGQRVIPPERGCGVGMASRACSKEVFAVEKEYGHKEGFVFHAEEEEYGHKEKSQACRLVAGGPGCNGGRGRGSRGAPEEGGDH